MSLLFNILFRLVINFLPRSRCLLISWLQSPSGEGNGTPLQYSCLENPMDGGAWWAAVHGVAKSRTQLKRFSSSSSRTYVSPDFPIHPSSLSPLGVHTVVLCVCVSISAFHIRSSVPSFFPGSSDGKESACNAEDMGLIPGSERSPGRGHGNPLQYSCLENPMDRGAWWSTGSQRVGHD